MESGRDNKDNATGESNNVGNNESNDQELQIANDVNEHVDNKDGSDQEHSLVAEINKSRRSNVDQESPHITKILEKTKSQRDLDNGSDRKTLTSTMNGEKKYPNSNDRDNRRENQRTLLTYSTDYLGEIDDSIEDEKKADPKTSHQESNNFKNNNNIVASNADDGGISANPNEEVLNRSLERVNSVKSEKELFYNPNQVRKTISSSRDLNLNNQNIDEEKVLGNTNQDDFDGKPQENLSGIGREESINPENNEKPQVSLGKIGREEFINPENNASDRQHEQNSHESEKETFESPHKFAKSEKFKTLNSNGEVGNYNPKSSSPRSTYIESEEEISVVSPYQGALDRQPGKNYNKKEENNTDFDIRSSESGKGMAIEERGSRHLNSSILTAAAKTYTKEGSEMLDDQSDLDERGVENYAEQDSGEWSRKPYQGTHKGGKEIFANSVEQKGSFRLSSSKSFMLKENTRNEKEISENSDQGYNLSSRISHNRFVNPSKERVNHHERGSAVKFTDWDINNDRVDDKQASGQNSFKDSDARTPIKSSSPEKIKLVDVVLRPSQKDSSNLSTEVLKTDKTSQDSADKINEPTRISSTPSQRKKEVIRINKELAPAVLLLLRKLEQSQNSGKSASQITPIEMNTQGTKRQKSLDDSGLEQKTKYVREPEKDMHEESNLVEREPKNHRNSAEKLKHLNDDIQVKEMKNAELVITKKSNRATSTSTLEQFCSSSKCQRTCKRCSAVKKISQKEDSPHSRKGNGQEDFNIIPTLEALAEKCKNGLKVGCSLLKNFYFNQDFVRFYYFQTHPGDGDMNEEL